MLKKSSKGFTLVELLVVIAIIGILATLATVSLNQARSKARDAKRISDLKQMATAMELHYTESNTYGGGCDLRGGGTFPIGTTACENNSYIAWTNFKDPQAGTIDCATVSGDTHPPSTSNKCYMIKGATATNFKICAHFENKNSGLGLATDGGGVACITNNGWDGSTGVWDALLD